MSTKHDNDDLTTDACPSPPRDQVLKGDDNRETSSPPPKEEFVNNPNSSTHNKIPRPEFSKIHKNTPPTAAFASVINISNANGIHIGSNYNVFMNNPNKSQKKQVVITEAIKKLFSSTSPVTKAHLLLVSPHVNEAWKDTARALGYTDGQISQFYQNHFPSGIKEVIYQFLLDWIQNEPEVATVGQLSKVLWETNHFDAIQVWAKSK